MDVVEGFDRRSIRLVAVPSGHCQRFYLNLLLALVKSMGKLALEHGRALERFYFVDPSLKELRVFDEECLALVPCSLYLPLSFLARTTATLLAKGPRKVDLDGLSREFFDHSDLDDLLVDHARANPSIKEVALGHKVNKGLKALLKAVLASEKVPPFASDIPNEPDLRAKIETLAKDFVESRKCSFHGIGILDAAINSCNHTTTRSHLAMASSPSSFPAGEEPKKTQCTP
jgi:hypothetical protein